MSLPIVRPSPFLGTSKMSELKAVKGDREIAEELRKKFFEALTPVCELLGEASEVGFEIGFGFGKDAFGRTIIQHINLMKKY